MARALEVDRGNIVRLQAGDDGTWFYCRVDELLKDGELLCTVVDAQSWADLALTENHVRQLHRDLLELKADRTQHVNRIKGLLANCGLAVPTIGEDFATVLAELRQWDGSPVPAELQSVASSV